MIMLALLHPHPNMPAITRWSRGRDLAAIEASWTPPAEGEGRVVLRFPNGKGLNL